MISFLLQLFDFSDQSEPPRVVHSGSSVVYELNWRRLNRYDLLNLRIVFMRVICNFWGVFIGLKSQDDAVRRSAVLRSAVRHLRAGALRRLLRGHQRHPLRRPVRLRPQGLLRAPGVYIHAVHARHNDIMPPSRFQCSRNSFGAQM